MTRWLLDDEDDSLIEAMADVVLDEEPAQENDSSAPELTGDQIAAATERFKQRLGRDARPALHQSVGRVVAEHRRGLELDVERYASQFGLSVVEVASIEASDEPYADDDLNGLARRLSASSGARVFAIIRLLKEVQAKRADTAGPTLMAARKTPGDE